MTKSDLFFFIQQKWYYEANYPMGNRISFVSDMTISKSELIIAYGAGDAESRTFIVKVRDVEHYFSDWKTETHYTLWCYTILDLPVLQKNNYY